MPRISRDRDRCKTGHLCSRTAPVIATQRNVFANGRPLLRRGDPVGPHKIKKGFRCVRHRARVNRGSRSVFVQRIPVARKGDSTDFGSMIGASGNVSAG